MNKDELEKVAWAIGEYRGPNHIEDIRKQMEEEKLRSCGIDIDELEELGFKRVVNDKLMEDSYERFMREEHEQLEKLAEAASIERELYPLAGYSITELKAEIRRRKEKTKGYKKKPIKF